MLNHRWRVAEDTTTTALKPNTIETTCLTSVTAKHLTRPQSVAQKKINDVENLLPLTQRLLL